MLNLLIRIEIFIDNILLKLAELSLILFKLVIPQKLRKKYFQLEERTQKWFQEKREKIQHKKQQLIARALEIKKQADGKIKIAKNYDYKSEITNLRVKALALSFQLKAAIKQKTPLEFLKFVSNQLILPLAGLKVFFAKLSPSKFLAGFIGFSVITLSSLGIYFESNKIQKPSSQNRQPASIDERAIKEVPSGGIRKRPEYYKKDEKQIEFTHVKMPIYYQSINEIHNLDIDFSLQLSSRFVKRYLDTNEHKLRDHMLMTMEPIVPEFPLEKEGKQIIRDKVLFETNEFLRKNEVEGSAEEAKIIYILGT